LDFLKEMEKAHFGPISQQKQKSHNTKSMIQWYINLFIIKTKENVKIGTLFPTLPKKKKRRR